MIDDDSATTATSREPRLAFSPDEVAAALGISRELVNDLIRTGQLGSVKAGRRRLISRQHVDEFLGGDAA
jgi:excisionase family DNA binding protein